MFRNIARRMCIVAASLLLGACMLPENFTAEIEYQPDASYRYKFSGTSINVAAAMQLRRNGALSAKDERDLEEEARKMRSNLEVKKAVHVGDGRFELESDGSRKPQESTYLFNFLRVLTDPATGVTTISSNAIKDADLQSLSALHIKLNGTLKVRLPDNAQVLSHNAQSTPLWGFGDYSWSLQDLSQRPVMTIRFDTPRAKALPVEDAENTSTKTCDEADCTADNASSAPAPQRSASMPSSTAIVWPLFALASWTLCMVLNLAIQRLRAIRRGDADLLQFTYGESGPLPELLILIHRNYTNLLEMPVLFYAVGVLAFAGGVHSTWLVTLGWAYVVLRVLHSVVHISYNNVLHRFALFATSNVVLAGMWVLAGTALLKLPAATT